MADQLSEQYVTEAFHSFLRSSLTQAKVERLLDEELLSSAQSDLMITGPALCLYFAALRSTTNPPSVPLPRSNKSSDPLELSTENCPPVFLSFFSLWSSTVPQIQALPPEHQHDLARIICNLPPVAQPVERALGGIAADLRAVAIEISQRRSFQERYGEALQAAIDSGPGVKVKASFVPPPLYDPSPTSSPGSSPQPAPVNLPPVPVQPAAGPPHSQTSPTLVSHALPPHAPPPSPNLLSPYPSSPPRSPRQPSPLRSRTPSPAPLPPSSPSPSPSPSPSTSTTRSRSQSPTILTPTSPAIEFIRETLYAALYDVLSSSPSLRSLLNTDPSRAYFASVSLSILHVTTYSLTPDLTAVISPLGAKLTVEMCPREYKPFMKEFLGIGKMVKEVEDEDTKAAMKLAQHGREREIPEPRLERVKMMLEKGVGYSTTTARRGPASGDEEEGRRRSVEGRAVAFTNRINALSLGISRLKAFKERQDEVFKVLGGIGA